MCANGEAVAMASTRNTSEQLGQSPDRRRAGVPTGVSAWVQSAPASARGLSELGGRAHEVVLARRPDGGPEELVPADADRGRVAEDLLGAPAVEHAGVVEAEAVALVAELGPSHERAGPVERSEHRPRHGDPAAAGQRDRARERQDVGPRHVEHALCVREESEHDRAQPVFEREQLHHRIEADRPKADPREEAVVELAAALGREELGEAQDGDREGGRHGHPRAHRQVGFGPIAHAGTVNEAAAEGTEDAKSLQRQAADHYIAGRYPEALVIYRQLAQANPQNEAYASMVQILER